VSEIEAGSIQLHKDDVRFDTVLEQLEADYQAMAQEKSIDLIFELPPKLPVLQGDRDKIVLAMHNLLGNAMKYTPNGGQVRIVVDSDEKQFTFQVNDSGIGINADELDCIFDKFYRASNSREGSVTGSGLGLALAREVISLHGGDITVESEIKKGSTFTMTLPVLAEAA
ncbi:MAG: HAMP domain-containing sensor histidine kinase, partial [Planctomycetota bacterium]|nr:HAMP domain-containing sensor histidine kinase [Planctomycetota bacterium]